MKRSRIVLAIILIASLASSLLIYKYYKLVLTLPLIIVGIALLISQRWTKNRVFKLLSLNFGTFFSLVGVVFSGLNLISLFEHENVLIRMAFEHEGDYGNNNFMLKRNEAMGLGYTYPANLKNYSSKKIASTSYPAKKQEVVYDVITTLTSCLTDIHLITRKTSLTNQIQSFSWATPLPLGKD